MTKFIIYRWLEKGPVERVGVNCKIFAFEDLQFNIYFSG